MAEGWGARRARTGPFNAGWLSDPAHLQMHEEVMRAAITRSRARPAGVGLATNMPWSVELEIAEVSPERAAQLVAAVVPPDGAGKPGASVMLLGEPPPADSWSVTTDVTVTTRDGAGRAHGCELLSPIFRPALGRSGLDELRVAVRAVGRAPEARVDSRCGFHVNVDAASFLPGMVGRSPHEWIDDGSLNPLISLGLLRARYLPLIMGLVAVTEDGRDHRGQIRDFNVQEGRIVDPPYHFTEGCEWRGVGAWPHTLDEAIAWIGDGKDFALNCHRLRDLERPYPEARLEFREANASLDPDALARVVALDHMLLRAAWTKSPSSIAGPGNPLGYGRDSPEPQPDALLREFCDAVCVTREEVDMIYGWYLEGMRWPPSHG